MILVGEGHIQCLSSVLISRGSTAGRSTRYGEFGYRV